jgi:hypothetical protein
MPDLVAHHYQCAGCGYDLYQQPLGGTCPECGKRIPSRRTLLKPKNSKRVNAGLRSHIRHAERSRRNSVIAMAVFALIVIADVSLGGPRWLAYVCGLPLLISMLAALGASAQITHARERIIPTTPVQE